VRGFGALHRKAHRPPAGGLRGWSNRKDEPRGAKRGVINAVCGWRREAVMAKRNEAAEERRVRDLPARPKGPLKISIGHAPPGKYALKVYRTGYRCNDAYSTYLSLGKPDQLNKKEITQIKDLNNGAPISSQIIVIKEGSPFVKMLELHENDVYLLKLIKL